MDGGKTFTTRFEFLLIELKSAGKGQWLYFKDRPAQEFTKGICKDNLCCRLATSKVCEGITMLALPALPQKNLS